MDIVELTKITYKQYGQSKPMINDDPCFFLQRNFKGEQDLLIIFKTKACRSNCKFCNLSNKEKLPDLSIVEQFAYVIEQMKHSLSVIDRITLSNNGSMLDEFIVPTEDLEMVLSAITQIKNISTIVLETDLRFINNDNLSKLTESLGNVKLNILTGFETLSKNIMENVLGKHRNIDEFETKLDLIAKMDCDLTAYILYKPVQDMTDDMAYFEALESAEYLFSQCKKRSINLTLRINPMFAAKGTPWAKIAQNTPNYSPPKLSDVFSFAKKIQRLVPTYVGLSTESKDENWGSYRSNLDFNKKLLIDIIHFNNSKDWSK